MHNKVISVSGGGKDGTLVMWEPGKILLSDLSTACHVAGVPSMCPKAPSKRDVFRKVFGSVVAKLLKRPPKGKRLRIVPLHPSVIGFEAKLMEPGLNSTEFEHYLSAQLDFYDRPVIVDAANSHPTIHQHKLPALEQVLGVAYDDLMRYLPATRLSDIIAGHLTSLRAVPLKTGGGAYFLPENSAVAFAQFADGINVLNGKCKILTFRFELLPTDESYEAVFTSVTDLAKRRLAEVEEGLQSSALAGQKINAKGSKSRLAVVTEVKAFLAEYEKILGVTLSDIREAALRVEDAVNAQAALACSI